MEKKRTDNSLNKSQTTPPEAKSREEVGQHSRLFILGFVLLSVMVAAALHFQSPKFADPDGFYHFRHASLYMKHGLLSQSFPWVTYSVMSQLQADIWYGFHLLLAPLTLLSDSPTGIKLCGVFLLTLLLCLFFGFCRRERLALPFLWPFVLLFVAPMDLWRWLAIRPHIVSTPLFALLLSFFCRGSLRQIALCGFAIAYVHQTLSWMVPIILVVAFLVRGLAEKTWAWRETLAGLVGLVLAFLLRPEPFKAARLLYIQIVELSQVKQRGIPLSWANEVFRLKNEYLVSDFVPFLLLWLGAVAVLLYAQFSRRVSVPPGRRALLWSSLVLSVLFFQITSLFSARALESWVCFGVVFVAIVYSEYLHISAKMGEVFALAFRRTLAFGGVPLLLWMGWHSITHTQEGFNQVAFEGDRLKPAMEWVKANSRPGEIVFHVNWALFPELFFWNQHNHFIGGMDPIFQYAYNPGLYWMAHRLESGLVGEATSPSPPGVPPERVDTYTALTRDFKASYLMLIKVGTPKLYEYALHDPRFQVGFDSETVVVFRLQGTK